MTEPSFFERVFWLPAYGQCFYCSKIDDVVPARYEFWFTVSGHMLLDTQNNSLPPYSECHTVCEKCATALWTESSIGMEIVQARDLR